MREPSTVSSVRRHGLQRHAEVGGPVAVHGDAQLWLALLVVRLDVREPRILLHALHQQVAPLHEVGILGAAEHHLHGRPHADATSRSVR